jgi:signal transduction histidine kinase
LSTAAYRDGVDVIPATRRGRGRSIVAVFTPDTWLATVHVMTGLPLAVVTAAGMVSVGAVSACGVLAARGGAVLVAGIGSVTGLQRSRFRALLGVDIPVVLAVSYRRPARAWLPAACRQIGYHLLALPIGAAGFVMVGAAWSGGLALSTVAGYSAMLPRQGIHDWHLRSPLAIALLTLLGVMLLFAAAHLARGLARLDAAIAMTLLGPSRADEAAARNRALARDRGAAIAAADAERRRIERDLHDGAQQRLVSLAMNLGLARAELDQRPEAAREAVVQAHDEAKEAIAELRDFVRGLQPAVLDDRGLEGALSGLTARTPAPVRLRVDIAERCSPTVEAIAYFVVSECLTNVTRHARASRVEVTLIRHNGHLRITVTDDGRGGATTDGTGLRGLEQRAASVGGTMRVRSPIGGPTEILVELPCEW